MLALDSACQNNFNLKVLPGLKVLPACVALLSSHRTGVVTAATTFLFTCSTLQETRKALSAELARSEDGSPTGIELLLRLLKTAPLGPPLCTAHILS